jgi:hypothetical protein
MVDDQERHLFRRSVIKTIASCNCVKEVIDVFQFLDISMVVCSMSVTRDVALSEAHELFLSSSVGS